MEIPKRLWIEMVLVGAYPRPALDIVAIFGGYAVLNRLRQPGSRRHSIGIVSSQEQCSIKRRRNA